MAETDVQDADGSDLQRRDAVMWNCGVLNSSDLISPYLPLDSDLRSAASSQNISKSSWSQRKCFKTVQNSHGRFDRFRFIQHQEFPKVLVSKTRFKDSKSYDTYLFTDALKIKAQIFCLKLKVNYENGLINDKTSFILFCPEDV